MSELEMANAINNQAGMGKQERHLFSNLGEYFWSGSWKFNVFNFRNKLLACISTLGVFNFMGKPEKKMIKI